MDGERHGRDNAPPGFARLAARAVLSLAVAAGLLAGTAHIFPLLRPELSLGFFDMLASMSPSAWLLLLLATAIVYVLLSRFADRRRRKRAQSEQAD